MTDNPYSTPQSETHRRKGRPGTTTIEISDAWVRRINSPLFLFVMSLSGVCVSFAPMALLWLGMRNSWGTLEITGAAICFASIFFVMIVYSRIANEVIKQVYRRHK